MGRAARRAAGRFGDAPAGVRGSGRVKRDSVRRIGLLLLIAAAIAAFFLFDLGSYLTIDTLKARRLEFATVLHEQPLLLIGGFFLLYVLVTALSLPGAAIMTLAA